MKNGIARTRIIMIARGEVEALDNPADRRVRMYATKLSPQAVIAASQKEVSEPTQTATR
jgi:hypothetical protein